VLNQLKDGNEIDNRHMIKSTFYIFGLFLCSLLLSDSVYAEEVSKEKKELIKSILTKNNQYLVVSVNGMCCRNCAIGIGKKVNELDYVDANELPKGIHIDRKNSLLTVAIKVDHMAQMDSLFAAIRKAGYDPQVLYQMDKKGEVISSKLTAPK
jgi:copper chaperone CopZ